MTAKIRTVGVAAAELLLGVACGVALLADRPIDLPTLERATGGLMAVEWPGIDDVLAALPAPRLSVRIVVDVR